MKNDYTYEMALTMLPGIGSTSARQLLDITGSAESVFKASPAELHSLFGHHSEIIDAINSGSPFNRGLTNRGARTPLSSSTLLATPTSTPNVPSA